MSHDQCESNWAITSVTKFGSNLFDLYFLFSKKHHKKKIYQKSSSENESEGKVSQLIKMMHSLNFFKFD